MIDQAIEVRVPISPKEAFRFIAEEFFANHQHWDPAITELTKTSEGPMCVGTTGREVRRFGGKQAADFRVSEYEPPRRFAFTNTSGAFWLDRAYTLMPEEGGTLVRFTFVMRPRTAVMRVLGPLFKRTIRKQVEANIDRFPAGVILVDLAPVREPALVLPAVAQALGLTDLGPRPLLERLQECLQKRELLIVLDNFEHVLSAAGEMVDLLAVASQLKILVTSRVPLHLRWEQTLRIVPLAVPDLDSTLPLEDLLQIPSVALFVDRAKAQRADFIPTEAQAPLLVQPARQLDGLPLAIELAAAHMNVLPLVTIARRLERHRRCRRSRIVTSFDHQK